MKPLRRFSRLLIHLSSALLLCAACAYIILNGRVVDNLSGFLPQARSLDEHLLLDGLHNSAASRWLLLGITGGDLLSRTDLSRRLHDVLSTKPDFTRVYNGSAWEASEADGLLYRYRYLLSSTVVPELFSSVGLQQALQQRKRELAMGGEWGERLIREDPVAASIGLLDSLLGGAEQGRLEEGVWVSEDASLALISLELSNVDSLQKQADAINEIQKVFADLNTDGSCQLLMTGVPVLTIANSTHVKADVQRVTLFASVAIFLLLLLVYRSWLLPLLAGLPLLCGVVAGVSIVLLIDGQIHGITLAFGMTLLGVVVDYPVHLFSHGRDGEHLTSVSKKIGRTLALGAATTAMAYAAFIGTPLQGLQQLGIFNIAGLLTAAAVTRWWLPRLAPYQTMHAGIERFAIGGTVTAHYPWLAVGIAGLSLLLIFFSAPRLWQDDLAALSPLTAEQLATDRYLRQAAAGPEPGLMLAVVASTEQELLSKEEALRAWLDTLAKQGLLSGYQLAADIVPSIEQQRRRQQILPSTDSLRAALQQAARANHFRSDVFESFITAVEQSRQLAPLTSEAFAGTAAGSRLQLLLRTVNGQSVGLVPLHGVKDPHALTDAFAANRIDDVHLISFRHTTANMMAEFRQLALYRLGIGLAVIALFLIAFMRHLVNSVWLLSTVLSALAVTAAIILMLGTSLSMFHLIALLLVAGIGMDYGLFLLRSADDRAEFRKTLGSIVICALSTLLVFGILASSTIPVLRAIGGTVMIGTAITLLFTFLGVRKPVAGVVEK